MRHLDGDLPDEGGVVPSTQTETRDRNRSESTTTLIKFAIQMLTLNKSWLLIISDNKSPLSDLKRNSNKFTSSPRRTLGERAAEVQTPLYFLVVSVFSNVWFIIWDNLQFIYNLKSEYYWSYRVLLLVVVPRSVGSEAWKVRTLSPSHSTSQLNIIMEISWSFNCSMYVIQLNTTKCKHKLNTTKYRDKLNTNKV